MDSNILRIEYLNGYSTGKMVIDMYQWFPCTQENLRKLYKLLCMGTKQMDDYVDKILRFMDREDSELKELAEVDKEFVKSRKQLKKNRDLLMKLTGRSE